MDFNEDVLSSRAKSIQGSKTLGITAKAKAMKDEPENKDKPVMIFAAGEPDFDTPDNVKEAAISAIKEGKNKYSPAAGVPALRSAVSELLSNLYSKELNPNKVIITNGAKEAISLIASALLDEGDEVIIPSPYWVSYPSIVEFYGGKSVFVETDSEFKLSADSVEAAITDKTKLIILNSPNNPSGAMIDESELRKIGDLAVKNNFFILSDEIYKNLIYGENKHFSVMQLDSEVLKKVLLVDGISKSYSTTGWRSGYVVGDEALIKKLGQIKSHMSGNATTPIQYGTIEALKGQQDSVETMRTEFEQRQKFIMAELNSMPGIKVNSPEGAFYVFPDISGTGKGCVDFCDELLEKERVAFVPGKYFGRDGHVRISYASSMNDIKEGMLRLRKFLEGN